MSESQPMTQDHAFQQQLGGIVRQLHDALRTLGFDQGLQEVAHQIPDARERLAYVGEMTERAANTVLGLVDAAKPSCHTLVQEGEALLASADSDATALRGFVQRSVEAARSQQDVLNDIMMAQDFQDLSGQVINKVIHIITRTEQQLVELLVNTVDAPKPDTQELAGPQVPDKALQQDDVDDLLASLGF